MTGQRVLVVLDEFQAVARIADAPAIIRASIQHQRDRVSYLFDPLWAEHLRRLNPQP